MIGIYAYPITIKAIEESGLVLDDERYSFLFSKFDIQLDENISIGSFNHDLLDKEEGMLESRIEILIDSKEYIKKVISMYMVWLFSNIDIDKWLFTIESKLSKDILGDEYPKELYNNIKYYRIKRDDVSTKIRAYYSKRK